MIRRLLRWAIVIAIMTMVARGIGRPRVWVYFGVWAALSLYGVLKIDPTLGRERLRPGGETIDPWALLSIRVVAAVSFVVSLVDMDLFHWSDTVPIGIRAPAMVVFAAAMFLAVHAMTINRFFSVAVRLQTDRGHHLVDTGPYRFIRHPGYLGMAIALPASALALGSWYGFALALVYTALIVRRAAVEDRFLQDALEGYRGYAARVRFRLLPGFW